jgi:hypothetical protein
MRILKNMRNKMVADSKLEGGLAPSYYIEGLLYNVPSTIYGISYENSFVKSINWMMQADRSKFVVPMKTSFSSTSGLQLHGERPNVGPAGVHCHFLAACRNAQTMWASTTSARL